MPKLKKLKGFFAEDTGVSRFDFPIVEEIGGFSIHIYSYFTNPVQYNNDLLYFPLLNTCYSFNLTMPNLTSSAVNYYLHRFLTIYPLSASSDNPRSIQLLGEPPIGQGLIDKQTLIDNGNIVGTN